MKRGRKAAGKMAVLLANFLLTVLAITLLLNGLQFQEKIDIELNYGKQEIGRQSEAQLFYAENLTGITEENSYIVHITENKALFHVKELDYSNNFLRIDPTNQKEDYEIKSVTFYYNEEELFSLKGKDLVPYMLAFENVEYTVKDDVLKVHAKNDDSRITFKKDFSTKIVNEIMYTNMKPYYLMVVFYFVFGILQIVFYPAEEKRKMRWYHWIGTGIAVIFLFLGLAMNYGVHYLETNFGDVPIGQLIYHMHTPLEGTNTSSFAGIAKVLIIIFLIVMILIVAVYKALLRIGKRYSVHFSREEKEPCLYLSGIYGDDVCQSGIRWSNDGELYSGAGRYRIRERMLWGWRTTEWSLYTSRGYIYHGSFGGTDIRGYN